MKTINHKIIHLLFSLLIAMPSIAGANELLLPDRLSIESGKMLFTLTKTMLGSSSKMSGIAKNFTGSFNLSTKSFNVQLPINKKSFTLSGKYKFANGRMHTTYLESSKYGQATFTGKIISYEKENGKVKVQGKMYIHGVTKNGFIIEGKIAKTKTTGKFLLTTNFQINLTEFGIETPDIKLAKVSNIVKCKTKFILK